MSDMTTHVLDLTRGAPAAGVRITLERANATGVFADVSHGTTDADGRWRAPGDATVGRYRLTFHVAEYFVRVGAECFFPEVLVVFDVTQPGRSHHVPLLLSPFGYSTYRGS